MSMYKTFQTDTDLETSGVDFDYGSFVVRLARAGGNNKAFEKALDRRTKTLRRAQQLDLLGNERSLTILQESYAEAVVLDWSVRVLADENGKPVEPLKIVDNSALHSVTVRGIEGPGEEILPYTADNVVMTFKNIPAVFDLIRKDAEGLANFRKAEREADAGN